MVDTHETPNSLEITPDVVNIMKNIREKVIKESEGKIDISKGFKFKQPNFNASANSGEPIQKAGFLQASEDLRFLNRNYVIPKSPDISHITSHRPGIIGKIIVYAKRKSLRYIWNLFNFYFSHTQEYNIHQVRFLNDISRYVDFRDANLFWELIGKVDTEVTKLSDKIDRFQDDQLSSIRSIELRFQELVERNIHDFKSRQDNLESSFKTIDSVVKGLESIVAKIKPQIRENSKESLNKIDGEILTDESSNYSYLLLENRFRGSEEEISKRISRYLPYLVNIENENLKKLPILEIGSGRGELIELLNKERKVSYGVDIDPAMVEHSKSKGLDVRLLDGINHLSQLEDNSLSGIIAIQVIEHLKSNELNRLIQLCQKKVVTEGKIIFETINGRSLVALSSNYFRDPTHQFPMHPDTISYILELSGLKVIDIQYISPFPPEEKLQFVEINEMMSPKIEGAFQSLNNAILKLNDLIYGYQDYCVIAQKI